MEFRYLAEHVGHKLKVEIVDATLNQPRRARITCETCGLPTSLVEAIDPESQPRQPFKPYPKSDTKGGKGPK